jgi:hypothetical protein
MDDGGGREDGDGTKLKLSLLLHLRSARGNNNTL